MTRKSFNRSDRMSAEVRRVLGETLAHRASDPRVQSVVITDVAVTRDLSLARVYYYSFAAAPEWEALAAGLERAKPLLRRALGEAIRARAVPDLVFHRDSAVDTGRRMEALLDTLGDGTPGDGTPDARTLGDGEPPGET